MRRSAGRTFAFSLALSAVLSAGAARSSIAAPAGLALRDVRILSTRDGQLIAVPRGTVLVRDGMIAAAGEAIPIPEDFEVLELAGRWVLPGFIDAHTQIGARGECDEVSEAITEDLRPLDAFDPWDEEIERALLRGVTAVALSPGDRNVVGGAVTVVKLLPERVPVPVASREAAVKASLGRAVLGSGSFPRYPTAPSGAVDLFGRWLRASPARSAGEGAEKARVPVLVRAETRSQAEQALSLLSGAGRQAILLAGRSLDRRALDRLAPSCPVVVGPYDLGDHELLLSSAAALETRGVPLAFSSGGERRDLLTSAVLAMRAGLSRAGALAALTENPARLFGLEGRIGRVEPGAAADLVVWSGDPFTLSARVELAIIEGEIAARAPPLPQPPKLEAPKKPAKPEVVAR